MANTAATISQKRQQKQVTRKYILLKNSAAKSDCGGVTAENG